MENLSWPTNHIDAVLLYITRPGLLLLTVLGTAIFRNNEINSQVTVELIGSAGHYHN